MAAGLRSLPADNDHGSRAITAVQTHEPLRLLLGSSWLHAGNRRVDMQHRDLGDVEHQLAEAQAGRFGVKRLLFHLAAIPTYIVAAELALNRVLPGTLPAPATRPRCARRLPRAGGPPPRATLDYVRTAHATRGHLSDTGGAIATAACQAAHAMLARRGQWVTNEKTLIGRAGLRGIDVILTGLTSGSARLAAAVDRADTLISKPSP